MADVLTAIRAQIERRLEELRPLQEEYDRLERAKAALDALEGQSAQSGRARRPAGGGTSRRPRGRPTRGRASGARAPRGARRRELLALVRDAPGLTVAAAARTMGISSSQASNLSRRLEEQGEIERTDQGLVAVTEGEAELSAPSETSWPTS
jgi:hypothetical protein